jgi:hypothetical protein
VVRVRDNLKPERFRRSTFEIQTWDESESQVKSQNNKICFRHRGVFPDLLFCVAAISAAKSLEGS